MAAVAVSAAGPVGVDIEQVSGTAFDGFAEVALAPPERDGTPTERARAWTRKEADLKARGTGLTVDPRTVVRRDRVRGRPLGRRSGGWRQRRR
ncbi:MAG: 4'-phosphopantetheinyl transferase superfamily protein [Frankiaceae bacterium]|nr:4'-phosphopantetheinyl transferase superfamily protein [Frankiaceae bacterium]